MTGTGDDGRIDATTAAGDSAEAAPADAELSRGIVVGRYVVLARLGAGGMGVVYAAYDPELDRKVAVKLLLPHARRGDHETAHGRLLRESQAMAKLSHPNVVAVHDVGEHEGNVFVAMEFVEGETLGAWIERVHPRWPAVLDVFVRAGRGLVAAHAKGLVHRDFKPDNVMRDVDGRVRVMDFGLARSEAKVTRDDAELGRDEPADNEPRRAALKQLLTRHGSLVGTPAYMAPEQLSGEAAGPAADQFALCVSLWEGLYGQRPFAGQTFVDLASNVLAGAIAEPPRSPRVPRWLRRAVQRGLAVDAAKRWPCIEDLLVVLRRGRARARLRGGLLVVGLVALAAVAGLSWKYYDELQRVTACEDEGEAFAEVWNGDARTKLRDALVGTGISYAEITADKAMPWLDEYADAWKNARTEACLDASVRQAWSTDTLDRSVWCLDERRMEFGALVVELSRGDPRSVEKAVTAATDLARVAPCRDADLLSRLPAPPMENRQAMEAVRAELAEARARWAAGAYDEGLQIARDALAHSEALESPSLSAAASLRVGGLLGAKGDFAAAEAAQEQAYFEALKVGAFEIAVDAADVLAYTVGYQLQRHADGLRWSNQSDALRWWLPDHEGLREARSLSSRAAVCRARGALEEAKALHGRALALREEALGAHHPLVATSLNNLAVANDVLGSYEEAKQLHERALSIREETLGSDHPNVATSLDNLAAIHWAQGSYDEAKALYEKALSIRERGLGPDHPDVATSLDNLAAVHGEQGSYRQARVLNERALAILERSLGPDHPDLATSLGNLAILVKAEGSREEARALHERALSIRERVLGPDHPDVARSLNNLANIHEELGSHDEARALYERALVVGEKALGPDHPDLAPTLYNLANVEEALGSYDEANALHKRALGLLELTVGADHQSVAYPLLGLARVALSRGQAAEAVASAERAVSLRERGGSPPADVAEARFVLARALWATQSDRSRPLSLAARARDAYGEAGDAHREALADVEVWISAHAGGR